MSVPKWRPSWAFVRLVVVASVSGTQTTTDGAVNVVWDSATHAALPRSARPRLRGSHHAHHADAAAQRLVAYFDPP